MKNIENKRVVITGFGCISSIGNNCTDITKSLKEGISGIEIVPDFIKYGFKSHVAGTIKNIDTNYLRQKIGIKSRYMSDSSLYSVAASLEAKEISNLSDEDFKSEKVSCIVGSGMASPAELYNAGFKLRNGSARITPFDVNKSMNSSCSANLSFFYGIKGYSYSISSACATSLHNIGNAFDLIRSGRSDIVISGGAEHINSETTCMFDAMRTALCSSYNDTPKTASRPYDKDRAGFVISGGAGIVILEELEHALNRNADIYAEIIGFGASSDGFDIINPHPEGEGAYRCMNRAIIDAGINSEDLDYINTHGTSTIAGDFAESIAIYKIIGDNPTPISSTKSLTGHGLGASGVQELIYCLMMMKDSFIAASHNIFNLDDKFNHLNIVTSNINQELNVVLTNSFGFGGTNASIILKKYKS